MAAEPALTGAAAVPTPVRLVWRMTERDYVRVWRYQRGLHVLAAWAVVVGAVLLAAPVDWAGLDAMALVMVGAPIALFAVAGALVAWTIPQRRLGERMAKHPDLHPTSERNLIATPEGLRIDDRTVPWAEVGRIEVHRDHVSLALPGDTVWVPRRAFGGEAAELRALGDLRRWHRGEPIRVAPAATPQGPPSPFAPPGAGPRRRK